MNNKKLIVLLIGFTILILSYKLLIKPKSETFFIKYNCSRNNGVIKVSYGDKIYCDPKTKDSGTTCSDNNQCEGYCLAQPNSKEGRCSDTKYPMSCFSYLKNGEIISVCLN